MAVHERYFRWPDEAWGSSHHAQAAAQDGSEVYFCVHLLTERRRKKETAQPISALWCEVDRPLGPEWPDIIPLPSARVESSPRKYHF